ncbi:MAG: PIN domain-containing protein [Caldilineaceae bacterium]|nr:PIN domain-containing protein [Caldilineaceae bacterium]
MGQDIALLDANILYPAPLRDLFLQLAVMDLFRVRWTTAIHREWIEALLRNEPHRNRATLERTQTLMDQATRDSLITGYEAIILTLSLPDPDDRHILAAAIVGNCNVIVTRNVADFPNETLASFGIEAQHPDEFLYAQLTLTPGLFCTAVRKVRARLKNSPYTVEQYLAILKRQGLIATVSELEQYSALI